MSKTTLEKFAYLLDKDNYIVENKIFIDTMWYIAKSTSKNAKSSTIRNSASMLQQIFYWHFNAIKKGAKTTYQYKDQNIVKMDFEDWWNSCRLTDREVTTANKLLKESGLVEVIKMKISYKDAEKPSNCYLLNFDMLEEYLNRIVEINKELYNLKVSNVREKNNETSKKSREKANLSTENTVTTQSDVTSNINGLEQVSLDLSTLSTDNICGKHVDNDSVTTQSEVTKVTTQSEVANIVTTQSEVTLISNTSTNTSTTNRIDTPTSIPSKSIHKLELLQVIENNITILSYQTWFVSGISNIEINNNDIIFSTTSTFNKQILEERFLDVIENSIKYITAKKYKIVII